MAPTLGAVDLGSVMKLCVSLADSAGRKWETDGGFSVNELKRQEHFFLYFKISKTIKVLSSLYTLRTLAEALSSHLLSKDSK